MFVYPPWSLFLKGAGFKTIQPTAEQPTALAGGSPTYRVMYTGCKQVVTHTFIIENNLNISSVLNRSEKLIIFNHRTLRMM